WRSGSGRRRTLITFGLSSLAHWAAGSVTSSQSHCVASTTVIFTARVTRLDGGASSPSILYRSRSSYGSTRGAMAPPSRSAAAPSLGLQPQRKPPSKAQPARPLIQASVRGAPPAKLPMAVQANDLVSTDRGQPRYALRSTGPNTEASKRRSRRNAVRHELTAETVV